MKKRIISVFITIAMLMTSFLSISATANQTVNLIENYTFEKFIALSADSVSALSEEIADEYNVRFDNCSSILETNVLPCIYVETNDMYETIEKLSDALSIPLDCMDISGDTSTFHITMKWDKHTDETYSDFVAKTYIWLNENPYVKILTFCSMCLPAEKPDLCGDINQNGIVDISDASEILKIYALNASGASTYDYTEKQLENADVNGDGKVDISDATLILEIYANTAAGIN